LCGIVKQSAQLKYAFLYFCCRNINQFPKRECLPRPLNPEEKLPKLLVRAAVVVMKIKWKRK